jgi:D-alanyl-lipoteichoic acid acyltransferase DltB (MBOAT superfamily)
MCFDRSGHSDVATRLGLLFGIALPANLNSPARPETS